MKISAIFCMAVITGFFNACIAQNQEPRNIGDFTQIEVERGVDLVLYQTSSPSLEVSVNRMDLQDVVTEVRNGTLFITKRSRTGSADIKVGFTKLTHISASGGSDIKGESTISGDELYIHGSGGSDLELDLDVAYLECDISGGSDADLTGNVNTIHLKATGGSDVEGGRLNTKTAKLDLSGGSDVDLKVTDEVEISAYGGSDVELSGGATVAKMSNDRSSDVSIR